MSKKTLPKQKPWKKHKQKLIDVGCGVRVEVDRGIADLIQSLNRNGFDTRHSCEGEGSWGRGYISMFATPKALGLAHYLVEHGSEAEVDIERRVHPKGYDNLTLRWPKKKWPEFETLVRKYFR